MIIKEFYKGLYVGVLRRLDEEVDNDDVWCGGDVGDGMEVLALTVKILLRNRCTT